MVCQYNYEDSMGPVGPERGPASSKPAAVWQRQGLKCQGRGPGWLMRGGVVEWAVKDDFWEQRMAERNTLT